ncbi:hypothetical protein HG535_0G03550 [Zygotorulaspora mrakii]|uniref:Spindle pole body component SPC42 n=1 Tax=Zygotorulaspora mrakii TaxID=42260 RepID=A0A7H9B9S1_ZYGMR|nr:uncharacterized protein HG535_0G03550 [Zygotorulaspora mrakii]QLG74472.1 hypothetical protein HG535_0G03550 [Zygotorulaspora mrakii]
MNISPTPRRYTSRATNGVGRNSNGLSSDNNDDQAYIYSDALHGSYNGERIIPEEYKLNSQMINRLIKQNKELISKLDSKQEEIDRLNVLVGSLRGKLIKYTEMNKKLQNGMGISSSRSSSEGVSENEKDYIQVPKRRNNNDPINKENMITPNDDRITALSAKLDKLTSLVLENGSLSPPPHISSASQRAPSAPSSANLYDRFDTSEKPKRRTISLSSPSEEDIMCHESIELKQMEDQIDSLKRKLLIKRENELRKISLNQELLELMDKLSMQSPTEINTSINTNNASGLRGSHSHLHSQANSSSNPSSGMDAQHCAECHNTAVNQQSRPANMGLKTDIPIVNPLETPTPLQRKTQQVQQDSINRIW